MCWNFQICLVLLVVVVNMAQSGAKNQKTNSVIKKFRRQLKRHGINTR